jgi:hypothetical protein
MGLPAWGATVEPYPRGARGTRVPSCPGRGLAWRAMRTMFTLYLLFVVSGLGLYIVIGLSHH